MMLVQLLIELAIELSIHDSVGEDLVRERRRRRRCGAGRARGTCRTLNLLCLRNPSNPSNLCAWNVFEQRVQERVQCVERQDTVERVQPVDLWNAWNIWIASMTCVSRMGTDVRSTVRAPCQPLVSHQFRLCFGDATRCAQRRVVPASRRMDAIPIRHNLGRGVVKHGFRRVRTSRALASCSPFVLYSKVIAGVAATSFIRVL